MSCCLWEYEKINQGYETNWSSHQDYRVHSLLVGNVRARADDRPRLLIFCFLYGVYRKTFLSEVHISVHAYFDVSIDSAEVAELLILLLMLEYGC